MPKTRRGRLTLLVIVLVAVVMCVVGMLPTLLPSIEGELPEISLAAENIPIPFEHPVIHIPNTLPATWLTMVILIGIALAYNRAQRKEGPPSRFQVAVEAVVEGMFSFMEGIAGEHVRLFFTLAATPPVNISITPNSVC